MSIRMPVKFHGSYLVVMRHAGHERREICQRLNMVEVFREEDGAQQAGGTAAPIHRITYYTFGCKRVLEGRLKENEADRVVFEVENREYEFSPSKQAC